MAKIIIDEYGNNVDGDNGDNGDNSDNGDNGDTGDNVDNGVYGVMARDVIAMSLA